MVTLQYKHNNPPPELQGGSVVALGYFDGVHLAHRTLIARAKEESLRLGLPLAVFTFAAEESRLKAGVQRLYSTEEKLSLLEECGIDFALIASFSDVGGLSAESFVSELLIGALHAKVAVCGYNFTFGRGKSGNAPLLMELLNSHGAECIILKEYRLGDVTLSTSYIRGLLDEAKLIEAANALGKPFFLTGRVIHGRGDGRGFGIPTLNIDLADDLYMLKGGVYATAVEISGQPRISLTNIGTCPTFGERERHAETFILDYDGNLYGEKVRIYFLEYLREEKRFKTKEELIMQINIDKNKALSLASEVSWQELGLK